MASKKNVGVKGSTKVNTGAKVALGDRFSNLKVVAIHTEDRTETGTRKAVMLDLGNGRWARLHVSQFPSLDPAKRDAMLDEVKIGDTINAEFIVHEEPVERDNNRQSVEVSARKLLSQQQAASRQAEKAERAAALAKLTKGTLLEGEVVGETGYGYFVKLDQFHTGLLRGPDQVAPNVRKDDYSIGDKVWVTLKEDAKVEQGKQSIPLSEREAYETRTAQARALKAKEKAKSLEVGKRYPATTVEDKKAAGLVVAIEDVVLATLPDADILQPRTCAQSKGQRITVEVVSFANGEDGPVDITVKQVRKNG